MERTDVSESLGRLLLPRPFFRNFGTQGPPGPRVGSQLKRSLPPRAQSLVLLAAALGVVLTALAIWLLGDDASTATLLIALVVGAGVVALTAYRPAVGCYLVVLAVPLTAGLGKGNVIPLLRLSEAITILVALGIVLHRLGNWQRRPITGLDLAVGSFSIGIVAVAAVVLLLSKNAVTIDTWRTVLGPLQYFVVYLLFSRAGLTRAQVHRVLRLAMVISLVIAAVGFAQLADLPGVRAFLESYYPRAGPDIGICEFGVCRPTSLIEHWSAFGAYAVMFYTLALALAASGRSGFSGKFLSVVMIVNAVAVFASQTQAAWLGIVVTTVLVLVQQRRAPRELIVMGLAVLVGSLIFFPQIQSRVLQQFGSSGNVSIETPQSLQTRINYWGEIFLPAVAQSPWVGTGTVPPQSVPPILANYADNEYLAMDIRAGIIGEGLLVTVIVVVAVSGWQTRRNPDPVVRALGAAAFADIIAIAIMGLTGEYLTFAGVSQVLWLTVALLPGGQRTRMPALPEGLRIISPPRVAQVAEAALASDDVAQPALRRLARRSLLRPSVILFLGNSTARILGLAFSLVCARLLVPADFGVLAYALVIATFGSFLVGNAPVGLARFLPRVRNEPRAKNAYWSNALVVVVAALVPSIVLVIPVGLVAGLSGGLTIGLIANILGTAAYATYREAQRGQERFRSMVTFYVLANVAQLLAVLVAGALGYRSPALFLTMYGLSSVFALVVMQIRAPIRLHFNASDVQWRRIMVIVRFTWPMVIQTLLYLVWFGADLVMVKQLLPAENAGQYAAAKTLVNFLLLAPMAIAGAAAPRIARIALPHVRHYVIRLLAVASLTITICLLAFVALEHPAVRILFGSKYAAAVGPLAVLALGMSFYGLYLIFEATCISLAKTFMDPVATGIGLVTTIVAGIVLIPQGGITAAALAFTLGAAAQVAVIAPYTLWLLRVLVERDLLALEHGRPLVVEQPAAVADEVWTTG